MKACDIVMESYTPIDLNGKVYDDSLSRCDKVFRDTIQIPYVDYIVIDGPIITMIVINMLVESCILCMKSYFDTFYKLLGFK